MMTIAISRTTCRKLREASNGRNMAGVLRIVRPVKRAKRSTSDKPDVDVCADNLIAVRIIGYRESKILFLRIS